MYENLEKHFAPNETIVSYDKLIKFCKHQVKLYRDVQIKIEQNPTYYVLQDPQTLKDYQKLEDKIEEWEYMLEILEERYEVITL